MRQSDWFAIGLKLLGVWSLVEAFSYLGTALGNLMGGMPSLDPSGSYIYANVYPALSAMIPYVLAAWVLLLHTDWLVRHIGKMEPGESSETAETTKSGKATRDPDALPEATALSLLGVFVLVWPLPPVLMRFSTQILAPLPRELGIIHRHFLLTEGATFAAYLVLGLVLLFGARGLGGWIRGLRAER